VPGNSWLWALAGWLAACAGGDPQAAKPEGRSLRRAGQGSEGLYGPDDP